LARQGTFFGLKGGASFRPDAPGWGSALQRMVWSETFGFSAAARQKASEKPPVTGSW